MAITAPTVTGDFSGFLPAEIAGPIFQRAARQSVLMRLAQQVPMGPNGVSIPFVSGRPGATWVSEGGQKIASKGAMTLKSLVPKKLASILVVSAEVVRANPGNYITTMRASLAESFAIAFDLAGFHDEGPDGTGGGGPFATKIDDTTKVVEIGTNAQATGGVYADLNMALTDIVSTSDATGRRYRLTGWALDTVMEPVLRGAVDSTGRPIWTDLPYDADNGFLGGSGMLLGRSGLLGEGVATANQTSVVGYGGDFSQAAWGVIGGINYDVSTEATVTINGALTSLWEYNLVAIRAEAEYGFVVADAGAFVKLSNTNNSPVTSS